MYNKLVMFMFGVMAVPLAIPAHAQEASNRHPGDMFGEMEAGPGGRPSVPSDYEGHADFFAPVPVMIGPYQDMLKGSEVHYGFGNPDMFITHPVPAPDYGLYNYPKE